MRELTLAQLDKLTRQYVLADGTWAQTKLGRGGRRNRARKRRATAKLDWVHRATLLPLDDLDLLNGTDQLKQAICRRLLTTPCGDLFSAPDYGFDMASVFSNIAPPEPLTRERLEQAIAELGKFQVPVSLAVGTGVWDALSAIKFHARPNVALGTPVKHAPWLERGAVVPLDAGGNPIERPKP